MISKNWYIEGHTNDLNCLPNKLHSLSLQLHLDMSLNTFCFIHIRIHSDRLIRIHLYCHLHRKVAIKDTELHKAFLMGQQMYLINTIGHTFCLLNFHNSLRDRTNHKFLLKDYQTQEHCIVKDNTLRNDQQIMEYSLFGSLYKQRHQIYSKVQGSMFSMILLSKAHTIKSNAQHKLKLSFQQSMERGKIVYMCDCLNLRLMQNNLMSIVFGIFLLQSQQSINQNMFLHNILSCHQHKLKVDKFSHIVLKCDQRNKLQGNLKINQHFYTCKFGLDYIHNCHLDIIQHIFLSLLKCLHNKIIVCHCNDQHMLRSTYQQILVIYIVDCIPCLIKYRQSIHQDRVEHMCMPTFHPIITNQKDIVLHMFGSYCQQSKNYLHIDIHICQCLDQHT